MNKWSTFAVSNFFLFFFFFGGGIFFPHRALVISATRAPGVASRLTSDADSDADGDDDG